MTRTDLTRTEGAEVSASEALLVEPSALSPGRRAFNTVVRSGEAVARPHATDLLQDRDSPGRSRDHAVIVQ